MRRENDAAAQLETGRDAENAKTWRFSRFVILYKSNPQQMYFAHLEFIGFRPIRDTAQRCP